MFEPVVKNGKPLRSGYTTGSSAAAAAKAAAAALLSGKMPDAVEIHMPGGRKLCLDVEQGVLEPDRAICAVRKDAGDDPDVTDGLLVFAAVRRTPREIVMDGGEGVGRVTKPGLPCPVGSAAINPVPREMIQTALRETADQFNYQGGFAAVISVPGGEKIARRTFNPRLGIVGGLSILGTTGIVEPMSEQALIRTIQIEIDARLAVGQTRLFIAPGNYGMDFAKTVLGLRPETGVFCSNYIGEALDYAVYRQVPQLLLIGHAGKLVKLAAGVMNTHSRVADARPEVMAAHAALAGAGSAQVRQIMACATTNAMQHLLAEWNLAVPVWKSVLAAIQEHIGHRTGGCCQVEVVVFTKEDGILAQSAHALELAGAIREEQK